jgi:hypothetical protein
VRDDAFGDFARKFGEQGEDLGHDVAGERRQLCGTLVRSGRVIVIVRAGGVYEDVPERDEAAQGRVVVQIVHVAERPVAPDFAAPQDRVIKIGAVVDEVVLRAHAG